MSLEEIRDVRPGQMVKVEGNRLMIVKALELRSIRSHKWRIHPCSAYTAEGLEEGMSWVVTEVASRLYWSGLQSGPSSSVQVQPSNAVSGIKAT